MTALPPQRCNENGYRRPAATGLRRPIDFNHIQLFSEGGDLSDLQWRRPPIGSRVPGLGGRHGQRRGALIFWRIH
jgi:hypothetical protein